jgi:hypothetical protein
MADVFAEICKLEPRVLTVFRDIPNAMKPEVDPNPERRWLRIKQRLEGLVGWKARCLGVSDSFSYEVAMWKARAEAERCCRDL